MTYPIVNISDWQFVNKTVSGTKEKRWYQSSEGRLALFKLPVSYTIETQITDGPTGETWSEKISSEIGKIMGLRTHEVDIATLDLTPEVIEYYGINDKVSELYSEIQGSLCWSFLEGKESLVEGSDMIMDYDQTYDRYKLHGEKEYYNIDLLYRIFKDYSIIEDLFKMIIFDTLIGNTDRHQDNFGVIRKEDTGNIIGFAPLYDNASSLGRELSKERVEKMLKDDRMFNSYLFGNKSTTLIRWGLEWKKKNIFKLFDLVKEKYPSYIIKNLKSVEELTNEKVFSVIHQVPQIVMSDTQKELVYKILIARRDYLLSKEKE